MSRLRNTAKQGNPFLHDMVGSGYGENMLAGSAALVGGYSGGYGVREHGKTVFF